MKDTKTRLIKLYSQLNKERSRCYERRSRRMLADNYKLIELEEEVESLWSRDLEEFIERLEKICDEKCEKSKEKLINYLWGKIRIVRSKRTKITKE